MRFDLPGQLTPGAVTSKERHDAQEELSKAGHHSSLKVTAGSIRVAYRAGT
jgi:hypothetical protein